MITITYEGVSSSPGAPLLWPCVKSKLCSVNNWREGRVTAIIYINNVHKSRNLNAKSKYPPPQTKKKADVASRWCVCIYIYIYIYIEKLEINLTIWKCIEIKKKKNKKKVFRGWFYLSNYLSMLNVSIFRIKV